MVLVILIGILIDIASRITCLRPPPPSTYTHAHTHTHTAYLYILYMNGYSNESVNTFFHQALILTDSVLSAAFIWITAAVSSMLTRMGTGTGAGVGALAGAGGNRLPVGPVVGAAVRGRLENEGKEREDEKV